ncbi:hypothetical protein DAQ1742_02543 [Dickeya aquatica]|uniref:Uncharacterized protein n=1 Tax=Dickeya aquatica TaxID=1401087 RepID=A0A375ABV1_9GAMM|nr:hypothetical protein DAQ1742_02543 [Dickeya aquatica]
MTMSNKTKNKKHFPATSTKMRAGTITLLSALKNDNRCQTCHPLPRHDA